MEIRRYWQVLKRRWPLVLIPAIIVLAIGLLTYQPPVPTYTTGVRFIVGQAPAPATDLEDEERYYNWLTSEYIVNGLTDWVRGGEFATAVSQYLAGQGHDHTGSRHPGRSRRRQCAQHAHFVAFRR